MLQSCMSERVVNLQGLKQNSPLRLPGQGLSKQVQACPRRKEPDISQEDEAEKTEMSKTAKKRNR